jgi:hypothetical protein
MLALEPISFDVKKVRIEGVQKGVKSALDSFRKDTRWKMNYRKPVVDFKAGL